MSKLIAIRKRIAALEAEAARITEQEMTSAIAKIKEIMSAFGLTIEHLHAALAGEKRATEIKAKPSRAGRGIAKYADPKTGKTWSGLGRAPRWIASAKSRESFLIDKSGVPPSEPVAKASAAKKKPSVKAASRTKSIKPAAKKTPRQAAAHAGTRRATAPSRA